MKDLLSSWSEIEKFALALNNKNKIVILIGWSLESWHNIHSPHFPLPTSVFPVLSHTGKRPNG